MSKLPTAEEFLKQKPFIHGMTRLDQEVAMIEFAKLHCIEQARVISEKAELETLYYNPVNPSMGGHEIVNKDSILNAYSLDLIK